MPQRPPRLPQRPTTDRPTRERPGTDRDVLRPDLDTEARLFERAMRAEAVAAETGWRGPDLPSTHATAAAGDADGVAPQPRRRALDALKKPAATPKLVRRSARGLSRAETALFGAAMSDVTPIKGHAPVAVPPPPAPPPPAAPSPAMASPAPPASAPSAPTSRGRVATLAPQPLEALTRKPVDGLDLRNQTRLRRGAMPVEAMLDLHGHNREVARGMLVDFIARSHARGLRCVLVITGKGGPRPQPVVRRRGDPLPDETVAAPRDPWATNPAGVIRGELPRWLNEPETRPKVLAFTHARQMHGGFGAVYVLLKRDR